MVKKRVFQITSRGRFLAAVVLLYCAMGLAQRFAYTGWIFAESGKFPPRLLPALLKGFAFDLAASAWLFGPLAAALAFLPARLRDHRPGRLLTIVLALLPL